MSEALAHAPPFCWRHSDSQSEWVHQETGRQAWTVWNRCQAALPEGDELIVRTDAATIRMR